MSHGSRHRPPRPPPSDPPPDPPRPRQRLRQDRPGRARARRCTPPASRSSPPARPPPRIAAAGVPVTRVEELTGFPECLDGRVKTLHPRVHAGILADTRLPEHLAQLDELGIAPFELVVVNLYPFTATVASGAGARRVRRADRHRRPVDGARGGEEPPERRRRRRPGAVRRRRRGRRRAAASRSPSAACSRPTRSRTPPPTTSPCVAGSPPSYAPDEAAADSGFPAFTGRDVGARRGAALRREPAPAGRALPDARRRRGPRPGRRRAAARQGDELQQLRRRRRRLARRARPRPARPSRSSSTPTRAASRSAPTSPTRTPRPTRATRSRRSAASSPPTGTLTAAAGRADRAGVHRGRRRPGVRARGARDPQPRRRTSGCSRSTAAADGRAPSCAPISGGLLVQELDRIDAPGDDPATWTLAAGERGRRRDARRPGVRLAGRARGEVERDPARRRRRVRRRRDGPGQPGRLVPARGRAGQRRGRRAGARCGRGVGRVLPVRRRRCRCSSTPGVRAVVQPGGSVRDEEVVAAAQAAGRDALPHGHAALRALSRHRRLRRAHGASPAAGRRAGRRRAARRSSRGSPGAGEQPAGGADVARAVDGEDRADARRCRAGTTGPPSPRRRPGRRAARTSSPVRGLPEQGELVAELGGEDVGRDVGRRRRPGVPEQVGDERGRSAQRAVPVPAGDPAVPRRSGAARRRRRRGPCAGAPSTA